MSILTGPTTKKKTLPVKSGGTGAQRRRCLLYALEGLSDYTFSNDNGRNPVMEKACAYVERWKEAYRDNTGLLLFGDVGTGKSFFASLDDYSLLVIDDLGVERNTEYAMEQIFTVIDSRYRCRKPLIVTTNLKLEEIKNPPNLAHARIYDRILERCAPVLFSGRNFREEKAGATKAAAKELISL